MALCDYILCCKCEVKLIYDGDRGQREWWHDRWGKEPEIMCPDCTPQPRKPLTDEQIHKIQRSHPAFMMNSCPLFARAIEAAHGIGGQS